MAIIDAHVHLYPPEVNRDPVAWAAAAGEKHWAELCTRRRASGQAVQAFPSVDQLLRDLDAAGVTKAILLGWYWENHATCVRQNEFYRECVRQHPDRLAAFAAVQPAAGPVASAEIQRAVDHGFIGLGELSPHAQKISITDPRWQQVLTLAAQWQLPVNLHVTDPLSRPYPGRVETPLEDFLDLARAFPATQFILAHWGGGLAWSPVAAALSNVWFDTAASPLLYGAEVWPRALHERVLFGTDYPLVLYPKKESAPTFSCLLAEAKKAGASAATLGENAARLLRL